MQHQAPEPLPWAFISLCLTLCAGGFPGAMQGLSAEATMGLKAAMAIEVQGSSGASIIATYLSELGKCESILADSASDEDSSVKAALRSKACFGDMDPSVWKEHWPEKELGAGLRDVQGKYDEWAQKVFQLEPAEKGALPEAGSGKSPGRELYDAYLEIMMEKSCTAKHRAEGWKHIPKAADGMPHCARLTGSEPFQQWLSKWPLPKQQHSILQPLPCWGLRR